MVYLLTIRIVVAIQYHKMEPLLVERIIAMRYMYSLHILIHAIAVEVMIANRMILFSLKAVPNIPIYLVRTIQATEIAQFNDKIHILILGCLNECFNAFLSARHIRSMEVRCYGKSNRSFFFCTRGRHHSQQGYHHTPIG